MAGSEAVVTGLGPISPIGSGREAFWQGLLEGRCGVRPTSLCDVSTSPSKIAAEVEGFRLDTYVEGGRLLAHNLPRPVQLALAAAVLALHDAELDLDACDPDRLGVLVGSSLGNVETVLRLDERMDDKGWLPAHVAFHAHDHATACFVSSFFNIRGPVHTGGSGDCAGLDALGQALRMIQAGAADAMLVIGVDCLVVPEILAALGASKSLATRFNEEPEKACRPFDRARRGRVAGEGAGALLVESAEHASARKARAYARVLGHASCAAGRNKQFDPDQPDEDPRPSVRALRAVLAEAGWRPEEVDVVNAHACASMAEDRLEGRALAEVFGEGLGALAVHSIKGHVGQPGAAASALQAIAACLGIRRTTIPPTFGYEHPDPDLPAMGIVQEARLHPVRHVLVHALGLGAFHASAAALAAVADEETSRTGLMQVRWSEGGGPAYRPADAYSKPLEPWAPRGGDEETAD